MRYGAILALFIGVMLVVVFIGATAMAAPKTIPLDQCGALKRSRSTYVLQRDVVADGTCFSVQDSGITLNLNGHSITYATKETTGRRHAIIGTACYGPHLDNNPCGGTFNGLTVQNGRIVQGPNAAPYSDAIRIGQGGARNLTVHDVEFEISGDSAKAISTAYAKGGHKLYRNTIRSNVKKIGSRHQLDGVVIKLENESVASAEPNEIFSNTIIGSAQGGIFVTAPHSKVYSNNISLNANYTNDFCIYAWANGAQIYANTCDNTKGSDMGRGIHVTASDVAVYKNVIKVRELPRNQEYSGCQMGGAYGIQLEKTANASRVYDNDVTALADVCDGIALRATSIPATSRNLIYHNRLMARRVGTGKGVAASFSPNNVDGGITLSENVLTADSTAVLVPWDGARKIQFEGNTFEVGSNPPPGGWMLFTFQNNKPSEDIYVRDPKFINGASAKAKMNPVGFAKWAGQADFRVEWTIRINVFSETKSPVAGALVTVTDNAAKTIFSGKTESNGIVVVPLAERRIFNTQTEAQSKQTLSPYSVVVEAPGFGSVKQRILATRAEQLDIILNSRR